MAGGLVEELQRGASGSDMAVTELLRKAKMVAVKLQTDTILSWINNELSGYEDRTKVPRYRALIAAVEVEPPGQYWQVVSQNGTCFFTLPVSEVIEVQAHSSNSFYFAASLEELRDLRANGLPAFPVRYRLSRPVLAGLLDGVRNKILDWSLELEAAGIHGHGLSFSGDETERAQTVTNQTTNIYGPVGALGQHGSPVTGVTQHNGSASIQEIASAVAGLLHAASMANLQPSEFRHGSVELSAAQTDLQQNRLPVGRLQKALSYFGQVEDLAIKAPELAKRLHDLASMLGWPS